MSEITPAGSSPQPQPIKPVNNAGSSQPTSATGATGSGADRVELSTTAQTVALAAEKMAQLPDVRQDLIEKAKANIDSGAYDGEQVIDAVLDNAEFIDDLS